MSRNRVPLLATIAILVWLIATATTIRAAGMIDTCLTDPGQAYVHFQNGLISHWEKARHDPDIRYGQVLDQYFEAAQWERSRWDIARHDPDVRYGPRQCPQQ
ncbi:MAG: hypothetical protein IPK19_13385 [Chloroflexi bacterium]|nr:hypothetical protein [Chloroflexota bacterium]